MVVKIHGDDFAMVESVKQSSTKQTKDKKWLHPKNPPFEEMSKKCADTTDQLVGIQDLWNTPTPL